MNVAIAGLGLIGGSFLKAAQAAGHNARGYHHGDSPDLSQADIVIIAMPPSAIEPWIRAHSAGLKQGALVVDVCGVKRPLYEAFRLECLKTPWCFVGGHPMAGKEVGGYANSTSDLFKSASMILTPYPYMGRGPLETLDSFFRSLGFAQVVTTTPEHHDEMIAFTSQLCHIISSAYLREPLALEHTGFSAGSFRDMVRVGAPDPEVWTELFLSNSDKLCEVLERFIGRLSAFQRDIAQANAAKLRSSLAEGATVKAAAAARRTA